MIPDFEFEPVPLSHEHDSMLESQISLVGGSQNSLRIAIREEWRARSQRHKWINFNLGMVAKINAYDLILKEAWGDKYGEICEDSSSCSDEELSLRGRGLLKWALTEAQSAVRPFAPNWSSPYYVRGSLQVLAINLQVGWHPNYKIIFGGN